ncbi:hypothetical protein E1292_00715 [Nonomuraea deserti]|uniref:Uncharacterized protein n=1 Tax=Nonomuraea deserti TaxID=1848322 RepID=A0A4R4WAC1_9ACTN|nr:hypothetical protein [Nonomuraea deserti]TDD12814.1 hypothetical protein E1292_00715 [Nonomuraea deserti]
MGMMLPAWVIDPGYWPPDEQDYLANASTLRTALEGIQVPAAESDATMEQAQQNYQGEASTALAGTWEQVSQARALATTAMNIIPISLDGVAGVISGSKLAIGSVAAATTVLVAAHLLNPHPLSRAYAKLRIRAMHRIVQQVAREAKEGVEGPIAHALKRRVAGHLRELRENLPHPEPRPQFAGSAPGSRRRTEPTSERDSHMTMMAGRGWFGKTTRDEERVAEREVETQYLNTNYKVQELEELARDEDELAADAAQGISGEAAQRHWQQADALRERAENLRNTRSRN